MEGRNLGIRSISATGLKKVKRFGTMHTYAVVWINPYLCQRTSVGSGTNPSWEQRISFFVPEIVIQQPNSCLNVEIFNNANGKLVGIAAVSLSELVQNRNQGNALTYAQVRRESGKVKGSLRLETHVGNRTYGQGFGGGGYYPQAGAPWPHYNAAQQPPPRRQGRKWKRVVGFLAHAAGSVLKNVLMCSVVHAASDGGSVF